MSSAIICGSGRSICCSTACRQNIEISGTYSNESTVTFCNPQLSRVRCAICLCTQRSAQERWLHILMSAAATNHLRQRIEIVSAQAFHRLPPTKCSSQHTTLCGTTCCDNVSACKQWCCAAQLSCDEVLELRGYHSEAPQVRRHRMQRIALGDRGDHQHQQAAN